MIPPSGRAARPRLADQRATVVEVGGGLRAYTVGARDVLDGYAEDAMCSSGRGQVLAPWPNRIKDGAYDFDGRSFQLALTEAHSRSAIHGLVRWASWHAVEPDPARVTMEHLLHPQPGYPFTLRLRVEYQLDAAGLTVRSTATNEGSDACPFGFGHHPYLTRGEPVDGLKLQLPAATRVLVSDLLVPIGREPVDGTTYDFRDGRALGGLQLDTPFTDLDRDAAGIARVRLEDLTLWVDGAYGYLHVFTGDLLPDVNRRSLGVEPMTCLPHAFRTGESLLRLEPGESFAGAWGVAAS